MTLGFLAPLAASPRAKAVVNELFDIVSWILSGAKGELHRTKNNLCIEVSQVTKRLFFLVQDGRMSETPSQALSSSENSVQATVPGLKVRKDIFTS